MHHESLATASAERQLDEICRAYWQITCEKDPFEATMQGINEYLEKVPTPTIESDSAAAARIVGLQDQLRNVPRRDLGERSQEIATALSWELERSLEKYGAQWAEFTVDAAFTGPQALVIGTAGKVLLNSPQTCAMYLQRCQEIPQYLSQAGQRLESGADSGKRPSARLVRAAVAQIDEYLTGPAQQNPLLNDPDFRIPATTEIRAALDSAINGPVRDAFIAYRNLLLEKIQPIARSDDRVGLVYVDGGHQIYQGALRRHTSTALEPDQVHKIGIGLISDLRAEFMEVAGSALKVRSVEEAFAVLRTDTRFRFRDDRDLFDTAQGYLDRASQLLPTILKSPPLTPCVISPMNPAESLSGTMAYYQPPRKSDGGGAAYRLNTLDPRSKFWYEYEALTYHESVPGHHTQISLAQNLPLPDFLSLGYNVAYTEGWALYVERLMDELDAYSNHETRLGMLSFALWRACRLVVDTGIHWNGWTFQQAIDFMHRNTGLAEANIVNEVNRYIGWPGQATGYMIGAEEIRGIRRAAQERSAGSFDLAQFHQLVLDIGPLPLSALRAGVLARYPEDRRRPSH